MDKHPIENIMTSTMENIRELVDVNTIIGDAVSAPDGSTIIPVSKVSFGFVSGGGEYSVSQSSTTDSHLPFGGGTGAGVSVQPMGFLVLRQHQVHLVPAQYCAPVDRAIELLPQLLGEIKQLFSKSPAQQ